MALALDAALWGGLCDYIDLASLIFAKLPLDAFFRLRLVCKEWNRLASDRAFLLEHFSSLQPPYFVVDRRSDARLLHRDVGWTWARLPPVKCESSGLVMEDSDSNRIFDLHTRMVHALPDVGGERRVPLTEEDERDIEEPVVGMIVDATVKPYAFRVVLGDEVIRTTIYDSTSGWWTQKESIHENLFLMNRPARLVSGFCDGILYIRVPSLYDLHCYDVRRDIWDIELLPGLDPDEWVCCDFGVWEDRLYLVGLNFVHPRRILVWELLKQPLYEGHPFGEAVNNDHDYDDTWRVLDGMPDYLWLWMFAGKEEKLKRDCWFKFFDIKTRFCGEYVLVYNSVDCEDFTGERAVLYSLKSRKWEKVDLPGSVV